jgi:hypothetical protein
VKTLSTNPSTKRKKKEVCIIKQSRLNYGLADFDHYWFCKMALEGSYSLSPMECSLLLREGVALDLVTG